jgi:hypothetical protein
VTGFCGSTRDNRAEEKEENKKSGDAANASVASE